MANLSTSADILEYMLFEAGEPSDGSSDFDSQALIELNRAYRALWMGGNEFMPQINEVWWWLKSEASIILKPTIKDGTVNVAEGSDGIAFSSAPSSSVTGYFLKVTGHPDIFKISAHTGGEDSATLDTEYTGDTDSTADYRLFKTEYDVASDCWKIIAPMRVYQTSGWDTYRIDGTSLRELEDSWPLGRIYAGVPEVFAYVDTDTIRFNRYGNDNGESIRIDYDYLKRPDDLADDSTEPLTPLEYRHVLADMGLTFLLDIKNDDRRNHVIQRAQAGLKAMSRENRSRMATFGSPGSITPRQTGVGRHRGPIRTESGNILG